MSQIYKSLANGPVPPTVATSYTTDVRDNTTNSPGTAIPSGNNLEILGRDTTQDNTNGIRTDADPNSGKFLYVELTNRVQGSTSTSGAVTNTIVTFTPPTIGTYAFEVRIAAYNETSLLGGGYSIFGTARFDGVNSNLCGTPDKVVNEEGAMSSANVTFTVSGADILINAVGYLGQDINWSAVGLYTFIGVV